MIWSKKIHIGYDFILYILYFKRQRIVVIIHWYIPDNSFLLVQFRYIILHNIEVKQLELIEEALK
jgi:hypothetical protein